MVGLGTQELLIILAILGVLFGGKKLPELGRGIGQAITDFKKSVAGDNEKEKGLTHQKAAETTAGNIKESPKGTA